MMKDCVIVQHEFPPGTLINIKEIPFVILSYSKEYPSMVKVISERSIWQESFGDNSTWESSALRKSLRKGLMHERIESVFGANRMYYFFRDISPIDRSDTNSVIDSISLLTLEEYSKYKYIFERHRTNEKWWLLTPRSTAYGGDDKSVFCVNQSGLVDFQLCGFKAGVRPVVVTDISVISESEIIK